MLEATAVIFNIAYVILAAHRSIWCWPMGIIGSLLSIFLFVDVRLYAEAVLFTYYVGMGFYGWIVWNRDSGGMATSEVLTWSMVQHLVIILFGYLGSVAIFLFLRAYTDAEMPFLDSFTTAFSFIATWLVAKKVLENWIYWIAIDSLTVYLYLARGLDLYALLSLLYTAMAVYGYLKWRRNHYDDCIENDLV